MVRCVLFDIDGTLISTDGAGRHAFAKTCRHAFGVPNGCHQLDFAGRTDTAIVNDFFRNHQIEPTRANFQKFFDCYLQWLQPLLLERKGRVLPGVLAWINDLKNRPHPPTLGLLTGNIRQGAQVKLSHYGLWSHFELGAYGDEHQDRNRVAAVAHQVIQEHLKSSVPGHQIVIVGDTPHDITCARSIGARVLAVATGGHTRDELQPHQPDWLATDLEQIPAAEILKPPRRAASTSASRGAGQARDAKDAEARRNVRPGAAGAI